MAAVRTSIVDGAPECTASASFDAEVGTGDVVTITCSEDTCVATGAPCAGAVDDEASVVGCCDAADACVQQSEAEALCVAAEGADDAAVLRTCAGTL